MAGYPGRGIHGQVHGLTLMDYGPEFRPEDWSGILSVPPKILTGKDYVVLVPKVDADGNDIAGIHSHHGASAVGNVHRLESPASRV